MPPTKQRACGCVSSRMPGTTFCRAPGESANNKLPSMRCAPSFFNKFSEHLPMTQRRKIIDLDFGGLLQFSVEEPESSDILVYLMDKLNPESMILEVGDEGGLEIHYLCVNKVLGLHIGKKDPPTNTEEENERALVQFRKSVHVERNKDVKCKHLLDLMSKLFIDNALAVRIFFVVAFNKLLFPALDNNIRGQDAFLTKDVTDFTNINWCKAVVEELCHAVITWRSEKKKSISGCAIFLLIFYLDNLDSRNSIHHFITPWAKFFHKSVIERIILEDKRRDRSGKMTFGNLQLRSIANTCYQHAKPATNGLSATADLSSSPMFSYAKTLGVLFTEMTSSAARIKATDGVKRFDAKASQAINLIQSSAQMLVQADNEFNHTMRAVLEKGAAENSSRDQDDGDKGPGEQNQSRSNEEFSSTVVLIV